MKRSSEDVWPGVYFLVEWPGCDFLVMIIGLSALGWDAHAEKPRRVRWRHPGEELPQRECGQCGITLRPGRNSCHWCGWKPDAGAQGV